MHIPIEFSTVENTTFKLLAYCQKNRWAGYDPYDALNSRIFRAIPILNFRTARLALTQAVKRSPLNLRPLLLVPKTPNPKGIALFLSALVKLSKIGLIKGRDIIDSMAEKLLSLRSVDNAYSCWGYNFDWQTRRGLVPKGSPNIICSTFASNALLDAHEESERSLWLDAAVSTADYIINTHFRRKNNSHGCFSYTQLGRDEVHNANLLGAAFLCRVSQTTGRNEFLEPALAAARFSISKQHQDGSWDYGEHPTQRWIDNFHTGFNLVALKHIGEFAETTEFEDSINNGIEFYRDHFFRKDGAPKYFHNAIYPIDIHSVAQSIITLLTVKDHSEKNFSLVQSVLKWAMEKMWDPRGFFYFQKLPYYTVRTSFMRWSQAWMLLALSTLLNEWPRRI
jgi:hypothetical protein